MRDILDNYYIVVYDHNDNYVISFEDVETATNFFNIDLKHLLRNIRDNMCINFMGQRYKLYLYLKTRERNDRKYGKKY